MFCMYIGIGFIYVHILKNSVHSLLTFVVLVSFWVTLFYVEGGKVDIIT